MASSRGKISRSTICSTQSGSHRDCRPAAVALLAIKFPIVFAILTDPVGKGLLSLAQPGGNGHWIVIKAGRTSSSAIATDLNARGIAAPNGGQWFPMQFAAPAVV